MNSNRHCILASLFLHCILVIATVVAQPKPMPESYRDPYFNVKDARLHAAFVTLSHVRFDNGLDAPIWRARAPSEVYNLPENREAIGVVLAAIESANLAETPLPIRISMVEAVKAAVTSGASVHIPALKKLAHSNERDVREAVASLNALELSPSPSLEVLKECVLSAEARLPSSLADGKTAERLFDEFRDRIDTLTTFSSPDERPEITPIVERFLARYDNKKIRDYYGPQLKEMVERHRTKRVLLDWRKRQLLELGSGLPDMPIAKAAETKPSAVSKQNARTSWFAWVVVFAIATGLLFLVRKNRRKAGK